MNSLQPEQDVAEKYYIDTSIWIDIYEDRTGYNKEPLGDFALRLLLMIKEMKKKLIITDILLGELGKYYTLEEINCMIKPFEDLIEKIFTTKEQHDEAKMISKERELPKGDVLHAIIARDNNLILITRDKHFLRLKDLTMRYKPEELT